MTAHFRRWFAHSINDRLDCADGLGAARLQPCLTLGTPSISQPNVMHIRSAHGARTRHGVVLNAFRLSQAKQFQPTPAPAAVKSP